MPDLAPAKKTKDIIERLFLKDNGVTNKAVTAKIPAVSLAIQNDVKAAHLKRDMENLTGLDGGGIQNGLNILHEMSRDPQAAQTPQASQAAQGHRVYGDEYKPLAASAKESNATNDARAKNLREEKIPRLRERHRGLAKILNESDRPKLIASTQPIMDQVKEDEKELQRIENENKRAENTAKQIQRQLDALRDKMSRDPLLAGTFRRETEQQQTSQRIQSHSTRGGAH